MATWPGWSGHDARPTQQRVATLRAADEPKRSAIIGKPSAPDMTLEKRNRRGNAADTLFLEMKRRIAAVLKKPGDR